MMNNKIVLDFDESRKGWQDRLYFITNYYNYHPKIKIYRCLNEFPGPKEIDRVLLEFPTDKYEEIICEHFMRRIIEVTFPYRVHSSLVLIKKLEELEEV